MSSREIFHVATFDAKARPTGSTTFSHQHVGGHPPVPTPLLMNAGTGLYNSDYTQPFKRPEKSPRSIDSRPSLVWNAEEIQTPDESLV